jgi:hypothetical protein
MNLYLHGIGGKKEFDEEEEVRFYPKPGVEQKQGDHYCDAMNNRVTNRRVSDAV